jgi:hypothetical protein
MGTRTLPLKGASIFSRRCPFFFLASARDERIKPAKETPAATLNGEALYELLVTRADELAGCADGSDDARELGAISAAVEAFEEMWWVSGRFGGGKG